MMDQKEKKVRALGLCSGGLDSILSALVLKSQGVDVTWISFETPFFSADKAKAAARMNRIPIMVKDITPQYMEMMKAPPCGFGKNMNPCMDCHTLMFKMAGGIMEEKGFDFLFSGEVMGQRPMSQTKSALRYVEKNSGHDGYIVRPLSAKVLPETLAEQKGLVMREKLLDITGRSRKPQMQLAKDFNVTDYPAPAGGCLLTDIGFSKRLKDLFDHKDTYATNELHLLKFGRHLRLDEQIKIIVGRTKKDNDGIKAHIDPERDTVLHVDKIPGPIVVMPGGGAEDRVLLAASICAGYSKADNDTPVNVNVIAGKNRTKVMVLGLPSSSARKFMI